MLRSSSERLDQIASMLSMNGMDQSPNAVPLAGMRCMAPPNFQTDENVISERRWVRCTVISRHRGAKQKRVPCRERHMGATGPRLCRCPRPRHCVHPGLLREPRGKRRGSVRSGSSLVKANSRCRRHARQRLLGRSSSRGGRHVADSAEGGSQFARRRFYARAPSRNSRI